MKLYSNKFNPANNLKTGAVLIYGNDYGLVKEIEKKIITYLLPDADEMAICDISAEQLKEDPGALLTELGSVSFFADERVTKISEATDSLAPFIDEALPETSRENFLIITAGELTPASKLRKLFEGSKEHLAVLCYKDDEVSVKQVIRSKLSAEKIQVDNDTIEFLAANLGADRLITNSELEKIVIFAGSDRKLSFEDAGKILASSSQITLSDLSFAVSSKAPEKIERNLGRVFAEHVAAVAILRALAWHFERLLSVKLAVESSPNVDQAVRSLRPQVFFRQIAQFKMDVNKWNKKQLIESLKLIKEAELAAKQAKIDEQILCRNLLFSMIKLSA